jgi:putative heme iron utilization protein
MTTRSATDNAKALDAFLAAKFQIDAMLERLAALSADHFEAHPDEINWGDVGTLTHYRDRLREISDAALREGEFAE